MFRAIGIPCLLVIVTPAMVWSAADPAADSFKQGLEAFNKGNYQQAVASFEKVVKLEPKNVPAHFNLALAYHNLNKTDPAIAAYTRVIELDSKHFSAVRNRGLVYYDKKD